MCLRLRVRSFGRASKGTLFFGIGLGLSRRILSDGANFVAPGGGFVHDLGRGRGVFPKNHYLCKTEYLKKPCHDPEIETCDSCPVGLFGCLLRLETARCCGSRKSGCASDRLGALPATDPGDVWCPPSAAARVASGGYDPPVDRDPAANAPSDAAAKGVTAPPCRRAANWACGDAGP